MWPSSQAVNDTLPILLLLLDPKPRSKVYTIFMDRKNLKIGELARACELSPDALRFYEKQGLITPTARTEAGYRLYSESDVQRVRFILHAKQVGFTLAEVAELLALRADKESHSCADVKTYTAQKLAEIEVRIRDLQIIKKGLRRLHDACGGGTRTARHCSILSALEEEV